jgi:hypothetical protein
MVSLISERSLKQYVSLFTVIVFSLSVFTFFSLAFNLWRCQAGGLFAAFLVAFSSPIVNATTGREFLHGPFALLLVSLHLSMFFGYGRKPTAKMPFVSALVALALLSVWEHAPLYLFFFGIAVLTVYGRNDTTQKRLFATHLAAFVIGGLLLPHLRAQRALVAWPALFFLVTTAWFAFRASLPRRVPGMVYIAGGVVALSLLFWRLHTGGIELASTAEYVLHRLRFLAAKPEDPLLLPDVVRALWSRPHTFATPYTVLQLLLPVLFLVPVALLGMRSMRKGSAADGEHARGAEPQFLWPATILAGAGLVLFLLDRSAVLAAALGVFPFVAASFYGLSQHRSTRALPVAIAAFLVLTPTLFPTGKVNATYQIASRTPIAPDRPDGFIFLSIGNADEELVRHLVRRTSVRDVFVAPLDLSSLLVAFAGRKTITPTGSRSIADITQAQRVTEAFYDEERSLFSLCDSLGVGYVVYSIDYLLDNSKYSPTYLAGRRTIREEDLVYKMHFAPEQLTHFNLVYQNDNYRVFRLTREVQPMFLTDHPVVYHTDLLLEHGGNLTTFYRDVLDVLVTYHTAVRAQNRGDDDAAIGRLRYCLERAPRFTKAWLGVGDSLLRMRDMRAANAAYRRVLEYAPDNTHALYYAALTYAHLDQKNEALGLIDVLLATGGDRALVALAAELKAVIQSGVPLDGSSPER